MWWCIVTTEHATPYAQGTVRRGGGGCSTYRVFLSIRCRCCSLLSAGCSLSRTSWLVGTAVVRKDAPGLKAGVVQGYGVLRPCVDGAKIGPLFASLADVAEVLARALAAEAAEAATASGTVRIMLDVPEPNKQGVQLAERLGLTEMCQTGRMYRGPAPELPLNRIFGVTNLELG